jgi:putative DNA primase/helicase
MNIRAIARVLGGDLAGGHTILCPGPGHSPRDRSLAVRFDPRAPDGFMAHSHSGDDWRACRDHVARLLGLRAEIGPRPLLRVARRMPVERKPDQDARRSEIALAIWQSAKPAQGTPVETYLASRGIDLPPPDALRFHAGLKHASGGIWPAMVALVTHGETGLAIAIHRTFFARDGGGKAPVNPAKMMLGPCRGGAVRLAQPGALLMIGEGVETCLSAMQATGHPAWAALSTSGLRTLDLPRGVRDVIVLADGDETGEAAAKDCARRWKREARRVRIARPPTGMDFNDLLLDRAPRIEEGVA